MKIDRVKYERVFNLGNYQSERVGAEAEVEEFVTPEATLAILKKWVHEQQGKI